VCRFQFLALLKGGLAVALLTHPFSSNGVAQPPEFASGVQVGQVTQNGLTEISGIVSSRKNAGVLWIHNDRSRDDIYAVSTDGELLATYSLGGEVSDMEDIAIGPGPLPELHYLYCGDIGDNAATRSSIRVYRAAEPAVYSYLAENPPSEDFPIVERITLNYPDGSHNAETLMIDPITGDLFIATKQLNVSRIYRADRSQLQDKATVILSFAGQLDFHEVSSGDISADGQEIILRQENFAKVWRRAAGQSIAEALAGTPVDVPVIGMPTEQNGEGAAWHGGGLGYYTISEGSEPLIYFFARTSPPLTEQPRVLIPSAAVWKYLDNGSDPGTAWRSAAFWDATWRFGPAQFGYGDDDQQTEISFGADKDLKHVTTYFRNQFMVENPASLEKLTLSVVYDDGVAVYLNGTEVVRRNLATNAISSTAALPLDPALPSHNSFENLWQTFEITNVARAGMNTIAVEVHRRSRSEGDLSFDLHLQASEVAETLQFSGPPRRVSAGAWALDFRGPTGSAIFVESSSSLSNWVNLGSVLLTNRSAAFTNTPAAESRLNFYRLRR
jgi:hypothetical protein